MVISAVGQLHPGKTRILALGKISVKNDATYTNFLCGPTGPGPLNGAPASGSVTVDGNWSGTNLVAGVETTANFGSVTADSLISSSASIVPTIASIIIKGQVVSATPAAPADTFGFVARKIDNLSIGGVAQPVANGFIGAVGQSIDTDLQDIS